MGDALEQDIQAGVYASGGRLPGTMGQTDSSGLMIEVKFDGVFKGQNKLLKRQTNLRTIDFIKVRKLRAMDWFPLVFFPLKVFALGTGMFFAIKWHYAQRISSDPINVVKVVLECAGYFLLVIIVFAAVYGSLNYLGLLPAGLDFV
ncbi:hypothetical protein [Rhizobium hainanense]|uniref:hypothetical protein n=1 Tax=Rhizobium hainanense TaxID=52131 RepID=UPI0009FBB469|nr:hypothetical protein [Rhizobium hainanense]